uniref:histidine phosphatase family protein n=1 Tax=Terrisporobacter sp. TaxID=1965305 RepID=UPI0026124EDC
MKKILYLMRHGQTLFNLRRKMQGHCDSPLTETGRKQAEIAGEYFENINIDNAYSSSSERCCDTLEIATNGSIPYTRLKGLKEMNFGVFEGESEDLKPVDEKV